MSAFIDVNIVQYTWRILKHKKKYKIEAKNFFNKKSSFLFYFHVFFKMEIQIYYSLNFTHLILHIVVVSFFFKGLILILKWIRHTQVLHEGRVNVFFQRVPLLLIIITVELLYASNLHRKTKYIKQNKRKK